MQTSDISGDGLGDVRVCIPSQPVYSSTIGQSDNMALR